MHVCAGENCEMTFLFDSMHYSTSVRLSETVGVALSVSLLSLNNTTDSAPMPAVGGFCFEQSAGGKPAAVLENLKVHPLFR